MVYKIDLSAFSWEALVGDMVYIMGSAAFSREGVDKYDWPWQGYVFIQWALSIFSWEGVGKYGWPWTWQGKWFIKWFCEFFLGGCEQIRWALAGEIVYRKMGLSRFVSVFS